ncbi:hypothetical protein CFVI02298_08100 [Campylobacter fetus subsp. venerealis cfvi02/298]|nr:hypothetical protein CFVI02298_08100 [Campylobacter fetus subsp. venerealis cfvi02/298]
MKNYLYLNLKTLLFLYLRIKTLPRIFTPSTKIANIKAPAHATDFKLSSGIELKSYMLTVSDGIALFRLKSKKVAVCTCK